jgi:hypothetical protein
MSRNIVDVLSERTGTPVEKVVDDMSKNVVLGAVEAKAYGLGHDFSDALFPHSVKVNPVRQSCDGVGAHGSRAPTPSLSPGQYFSRTPRVPRESPKLSLLR